jgi:PAS domain S-box-containing protein
MNIDTGAIHELGQVEERMRSVVNHVVDGIITIDQRGIVTTFNPAAERIFGYPAHEVIGQNVKLLMPDPYHGEHDGYIGNYLRTGQAKIIGIGREVVGRRKDDSTFPMELAISEFRLGNERFFTGIVRDITERKQAEEELRRAEERMRSVVDHVIDGIITIDEYGSIESVNPAAEKLFGYCREEVIGQNVKMLMPEPYHGQHDGYVRNYLNTGQAKIIGIGREVVGRRKDSSTFPMDLAVSEFHLGDRRFFTGIVRDITERKQAEEVLRASEERLRLLLESTKDYAIIMLDPRGHVMAWNVGAERIKGYTAEEIIGQPISRFYTQEAIKEGWPQREIDIAIRDGRFEDEGWRVRKDGSTFWANVIMTALYDSAGKLRGFTKVTRDITERRRLEQELRQRLEDLAEADRQKNEFLAMLAHELRNPMAPMRNALHLMKMPGIDEEMAGQARGMMERQLDQLVRLVDDLLDISRIIRGKIELHKEVLDLTIAVMRAVETAQPVVEAQGHGLSIELPDKPIWVEADLIRLSQVIANLLTNAAKYTDRAGRISLAAETDNDEAVVRVQDSGIGIAQEMLPRIFDLFVQGDRSLARSQGGLGIGLTLVKRLVEMHSGSVSATSAGIGKGSEFVIRLPVVSVSRAAIGGRVPYVSRPHVTDALRRRVLVVDDNVDAAESIAMILRLSGYDVRCTYDGPSVLETARGYRPDIVVLDIGLPGMSGYEVAQQLRRQPGFERVPLVAVTGYGQEEDRRRSLEAGFDFHLTKPVDPQALQAFVASQPLAT